MIPGKRMYGFLTPAGRLAGLATQAKCSGYCDGWALSDDEGDPPFLVEDPEQLGRILFKDTPHYNTEQGHPGWGPFKREQLTPVAVELRVEAVDIKPPAGVESDDIIDSRDLPWAVVKMYTGLVPDAARRYVGVVAKGESHQYGQLLGLHVAFGDLHNLRRVDWIGPMPEEWPRADRDPPGCVLVCSVPRD